MSASRSEIAAYLDELLKPETYKDYCPNGIQVYGKEEIRHIATCTSVSEEFFSSARSEGADLLLTHHGLFWNNTSRVIDPLMGRRLRLLLDNQINLFAYHLPLDAHPGLGNNARLADLLELRDLNFSFGHYHGIPLGCVGNLPAPLPIEKLVDVYAKGLQAEPAVFAGRSRTCTRIGVVSGGAGDIPMLLEARTAGCDTFVTGVLFEQSVAIAREAGLNVVVLGHYNSEKLGVRAVGQALAERFPVEVVNLDVPNPV
jgi:dinuclear metal center YbgI/SA1388 family protein